MELNEIPPTVLRFRLVMVDVQLNEATMRLYGPGSKYLTEITLGYVNTPLESVPLGRSLSLEEFLSCLRF